MAVDPILPSQARHAKPDVCPWQQGDNMNINYDVAIILTTVM